jgi:NAD(P)-dependent dehydrogenase (short-subunit alcohol dehydrogenase family)
VTGVSRGLGLVAARELARRGYRVLGTSRSAGKGPEAVAALPPFEGGGSVEFLPADLARPAEARALVERVAERVEALDVLVANAGAYFPRPTLTEEGIEATFALNHLGVFLPTVLLLPLLRRSAEARVVVVSSNAALAGRPALDERAVTGAAGRYSGFAAYARSKLANQLFTWELARRLEGSSVTAVAMHPGFVATGFARDGGGALAGLVAVTQALFGRSPERGADTIVWAATAPEARALHGRYLVDRRERSPAPRSLDRGAQEALWRLSERLTGLAVDGPEGPEAREPRTAGALRPVPRQS